MKTYKITDGLRLVRYGNRLRAEIGDERIDDIDGSAVAQIVDFLVDVLNGTAGVGDGVTVSSDGGGIEVEVNTTVDGLVTIRAIDPESGEVTDSCGLSERHEVRLLTELLTGMLAKLCEEGGV